MGKATDNNTVLIEFKPDGDKALLSAINALDVATKKLVQTQASMSDDDKLSAQNKKLITNQARALNNQLAKQNLMIRKGNPLYKLWKKAMLGDYEALKKLKAKLDQTTASMEFNTKAMNKNRKGILDTEHSTRILGGSLAILRSKLLVGAFAMNMLERTVVNLVKAYGQQEASELKVSEAIKRTGGNAGVSATQIRRLSESLQENGVIGDEVNMHMASVMLTYDRIGSTVFPKALKSANDMATALAMGIPSAGDLESKVVMLSKALQEPTKGMVALRKVGFSLSEQQAQSVRDFENQGEIIKAQNIILEASEAQYAGVAGVIRDSTLGQMNALSMATGDLAERTGKILTPALLWTVDGLKSITEFLGVRELIILKDTLKGVIKMYAVLRVATMLQVRASKAIFSAKAKEVAMTLAQKEALKKATFWQRAMNKATVANPYIKVTMALYALYGVYKALSSSQEDMVRKTRELADANLEYLDSLRSKELIELNQELFKNTKIQDEKSKVLEKLKGDYKNLKTAVYQYTEEERYNTKEQRQAYKDLEMFDHLLGKHSITLTNGYIIEKVSKEELIKVYADYIKIKEKELEGHKNSNTVIQDMIDSWGQLSNVQKSALNIKLEDRYKKQTKLLSTQNVTTLEYIKTAQKFNITQAQLKSSYPDLIILIDKYIKGLQDIADIKHNNNTNIALKEKESLDKERKHFSDTYDMKRLKLNQWKQALQDSGKFSGKALEEYNAKMANITKEEAKVITDIILKYKDKTVALKQKSKATKEYTNVANSLGMELKELTTRKYPDLTKAIKDYTDGLDTARDKELQRQTDLLAIDDKHDGGFARKRAELDASINLEIEMAQESLKLEKQIAGQKYDQQAKFENLSTKQQAYWNAKKKELQQEQNDWQVEKTQELQDKIQGMTTTFLSDMLSRKEASYEEQTSKELESLKKTDDYKEASDTRKEQMEKDIQNKLHDERVKAFRAKQLLAVSNIAIDYIQASAKGFAEGGVLGIPFSTWMATLAVAESAIIMAQKPPQKFAKGGDFVTDRPELIMVGEAGREHVKITPVDRPESRALKDGGSITINISAPLVDETVIDHIIPAINKAQRMNLA